MLALSRLNFKTILEVSRNCSGERSEAVQELAGHQDLAPTQRYMHLSPAALEHAIRVLDGPRTDPWRNGGREGTKLRNVNKDGR